MVLPADRVKLHGDSVRHAHGDLDVQVCLAARILALGISAIVDELDGQVGPFGEGRKLVNVLFQLVVLRGLLCACQRQGL